MAFYINTKAGQASVFFWKHLDHLKCAGRKLYSKTFQRRWGELGFPTTVGGKGAWTVPKYYDMQRWRLDINLISYQRNISSFWMDDASGRLTLMFLSGSHLFGSNYPPTHTPTPNQLLWYQLMNVYRACVYSRGLQTVLRHAWCPSAPTDSR